nr:hypothetical protein [Tanacetum cinerariifolium]
MSPETMVHQCPLKDLIMLMHKADLSRHMTGNKSYVTDYEEIDGGFIAFGDYEEIDGGYVAFGGNPKRGKITGKDDYSRFTWVFFLSTKDETSGILKSFITRIENLVDHKYSVARTPQQNEVAKRRNRTLLEAARTMLANLKLPTTFWTEAVNTACYLQNRPVVAGTQSNGNAGTKDDNNAEPKNSQDARLKPSNDVRKKVNEVPRQGNECNDQEEKDSVMLMLSTVNAASNKVNAVGRKSSIKLPDDLNMPELEDISI